MPRVTREHDPFDRAKAALHAPGIDLLAGRVERRVLGRGRRCNGMGKGGVGHRNPSARLDQV